MAFLADTDWHADAVHECERATVRVEIDAELHAVACQVERCRLPGGRESGVELDPVTTFDHAGEAVHDAGQTPPADAMCTPSEVLSCRSARSR